MKRLEAGILEDRLLPRARCWEEVGVRARRPLGGVRGLPPHAARWPVPGHPLWFL